MRLIIFYDIGLSSKPAINYHGIFVSTDCSLCIQDVSCKLTCLDIVSVCSNFANKTTLLSIISELEHNSIIPQLSKAWVENCCLINIQKLCRISHHYIPSFESQIFPNLLNQKILICKFFKNSYFELLMQTFCCRLWR